MIVRFCKHGNKERTKLEVEPSEAKIVADIFDVIVDGKGLIEPVRELNGRGILSPKGKGWTKPGVYFILTNEIYTGVFIWGKNNKRGNEPVRTENVCTPIIDRETFLEAQTLMSERMPKRVQPRRTG